MVYLNLDSVAISEWITAFKGLESSNHSFLHYFCSLLAPKAVASIRQCTPSFIFYTVPGNSLQVPPKDNLIVYFPISLLLLLIFTPFGKIFFLPLGFPLYN